MANTLTSKATITKNAGTQFAKAKTITFTPYEEKEIGLSDVTADLEVVFDQVRLPSFLYIETDQNILVKFHEITQVAIFVCSHLPVHFGGNSDDGTASAGGATTLTDSSKSWTVDEWEDYVVMIVGGTGKGQRRRITANTATQLTVATAWDTTPDNTSEYIIQASISHLYLSNNSGSDAAVKVFLA